MQISDTQKRFIRRWGEMGTRWGIARSTAMVHGYLYLCREAVNAEDICSALELARSNVSTSLKELEQFRLIERESKSGDRRTFYVAVSDVWEMARRILEERRRRDRELQIPRAVETAGRGHGYPAAHPARTGRHRLCCHHCAGVFHEGHHAHTR